MKKKFIFGIFLFIIIIALGKKAFATMSVPFTISEAENLKGVNQYGYCIETLDKNKKESLNLDYGKLDRNASGTELKKTYSIDREYVNDYWYIHMFIQGNYLAYGDVSFIDKNNIEVNQESKKIDTNGIYAVELMLEVKQQGKGNSSFKVEITSKNDNVKATIDININDKTPEATSQENMEKNVNNNSYFIETLDNNKKNPKNSQSGKLKFENSCYVANYKLSKTEQNERCYIHLFIQRAKFTDESFLNKIDFKYNNSNLKYIYKESAEFSNDGWNSIDLIIKFEPYYKNMPVDFNIIIDTDTIIYIKLGTETTVTGGTGSAGGTRITGAFVDVLDDVNNYTPGIDYTDNSALAQKAGTILGIISNVGILLSVLIPAVLGIKYMLASYDGKADIKSGLIPYFIGSIVLFGICSIIKILQTFGKGLNNI